MDEPQPGGEPVVTNREAEVLALLARQLTNAQIAEQMYISVRTVESHVSSLLRKLQLPDRRFLARHALDARGAAEHGPTPASASSFPVVLTSFVGRTAERAALAEAVVTHRMVTATGPGGVGKTRLAIAVADDLTSSRRDGAWFVDLVQVTDPTMVFAAIGHALGVPEPKGGSLDDAVLRALRDRDGIVVIDNCEHLLDGVRECVERVLTMCPSITVLATSRARLLVPFEWVYPVPGLTVTDDGGDAVALFTDRATAAIGEGRTMDRSRVAAVCRALDGMALAIELAAARYSTLGLDGLEAGIDERLRFLTTGRRVNDRHRSLRATIDWSYELLISGDRMLLREISVFAGPFTVAAAQAVVGGAELDSRVIADGLARLADASLLVVVPGEQTRYRALETIRQYGTEQLVVAGELRVLRIRHAEWCRSTARALRRDQADDAWCDEFDQVVDELRAALLWSSADDAQRSEASELASELAALSFLRGRLGEAQRRYEQAAALTGLTRDRCRLLELASGAASTRHVGNDALRLLRAAAEVASSAGDRATCARNLALVSILMRRGPGLMAVPTTRDEHQAVIAAARLASDGSLIAAAAIATADAFDGDELDPGRLELGERAVELAYRSGDGVMESAALDQQCAVHLARGDVRAAADDIRRRVAVVEALPLDALAGLELSDLHAMACEVHLAAGDLRLAGEHADSMTELPFYRDERHLATARRLKVDALGGQLDDVVKHSNTFRTGWERAGRPIAPNLGSCAHAVAMTHGLLGNEDGRQAWIRITIDLGVPADRLAGCETGWAPTFDAIVALHNDDPDAALERLAADVDDLDTWGWWHTSLWRPWYAAAWVEAAVLCHDPRSEDRIARSRPRVRDNQIAVALVERAAALHAGDTTSLQRLATELGSAGCQYQQSRTLALATHRDER